MRQTQAKWCARADRRVAPAPVEARWDVLEFLARVVDHIPEPSQQMVRYWGYYANAARGKRRKAAETADTTPTPGRQDDDEFTRRTRLTWAKLIPRVYEVAPLLCPFCGAEMKILAFIVDFGAAKAIRKELEAPGSGARAPGSRASAGARAHRRVRLSLWFPVPTPEGLGQVRPLTLSVT